MAGGRTSTSTHKLFGTRRRQMERRALGCGRSEDEGGTMHRSVAAAGAAAPPIATRWPVLAACPDALTWLGIQGDLGLAPRTIEAYARGLADYLAVCQREGIDPQQAGRADVARYVRDLSTRPSHRGP